MITSKLSRRAFAGSLAAPFFIANLQSKPRSSRLGLASFGADGMAWATLDGIATHASVTLVCVAEVDANRLKRVKAKYPEARIYQDWREMVQKERKNLDIACVGTPDHMHAPQAMTAMRAGLHVYQQKPLAHDIFEVRKLTEYARSKRLVTQMGIQIHSAPEYRTAVHTIQSGAIGKVKEVHTWSNKKWGDTNALPDGTDPIPEGLAWDQWLGVAAARPYLKGVYHPGNWRKRLDFGTATFGDMGCHIYDPVFEALALTAPVSVRSEGPAPNQQSWAINALIRYVFPGTRFTEGKTVNVTWYDGDQKPPAEVLSVLGSMRAPGQGSIFFGTEGAMVLPHIGMPVLLGEKVKDKPIEKKPGTDHYHQFVDTVLGKASTSAGFDYSGPLTEAVLLGPTATRFPHTNLEWNSRKLKFTNSPEATKFVRRKYRDGWKVKGL
ncbi:MAG: Gfo/Idh/MocA family oxidoreductase [Acidobacteria bacterium]|nr:Gfo/Idh/MocA family oxidoreductase [Acidobacteriota bacterium]